jgi:hypothetical protein
MANTCHIYIGFETLHIAYMCLSQTIYISMSLAYNFVCIHVTCVFRWLGHAYYIAMGLGFDGRKHHDMEGPPKRRSSTWYIEIKATSN